MQKYKSEISYNCFFISYYPKLVIYISAIGVNYSFSYIIMLNHSEFLVCKLCFYSSKGCFTEVHPQGCLFIGIYWMIFLCI